MWWQVNEVIEQIKVKFGPLVPSVDAARLISESGEFPAVSMKSVSRHFPPVVHRWSSSQSDTAKLLPAPLVTAAPSAEGVLVGSSHSLLPLPKPRIYQHELLQTFSFHLFAKRPMEPITTLGALRRDITRRIALSALQIR